MQSRSARTLPAELHRSSGAKERRHQDDKVSFTTPCSYVTDLGPAGASDWTRYVRA